MRAAFRLSFALVFTFTAGAPAFGDDPVRKDAFGDPLPEGALMRLGTVRFRANGAARLSPDGKWVAVADLNRSVLLLDAADGSRVRQITLDSIGAQAFTFSPTGDALAVASFNNGIGFYDTATGRPLGRVDAKQNTPFGQTLAFSADGKTLLTAPQQGFNQKAVIHAYEAPGGKEIGAFEPPHDSQVGIAVAPDGKTAASWGAVQSRAANNPAGAAKPAPAVVLWDVAGAREERRIESDQGVVTAGAYSPDGKILALAFAGGVVQLWDPVSVKLVDAFHGRAGRAAGLSFSRDGKTLLCFGAEGVQAWDVAAGRRLETAEPPPGQVVSVAFAGDGRPVACSQDATEVRTWEVFAGGRPAAPRVGHATPVAAVAFAADGKRLWSAAADGELVQWDAATGKELRRSSASAAVNGPRYYNQNFRGMSFSPGARYLLASSFPVQGFAVRETATNQAVFTLPADMNPGLPGGAPVGFAPEGAMVAAATKPRPAEDANVYVLDPDSGRELFVLKGFKGPPGALAVSPDHKTVALAQSSWPPAPQGPAPDVMVWTLGKDAEPRRLATFGRPDFRGVQWLGYSPDGRVLAATDVAGVVVVWNAATGANGWQSPAAEGFGPGAAAFSPDGRLLAVGSGSPSDPAGGGVRLWEVASGKVRRQFTGNMAQPISLAFSPDGRVLAAGCQDTTVLLFDATDGPAADAKKELKPDELESLWADLAAADAATAGRAVARLAAAPSSAAPLLKERVRIAPAGSTDEAAFAKLIDALDDDDVHVREKAQHDLAAAGSAAVPAMRKALAGRTSPEQRWRLEELLAGSGKPDFSPNALRLRRAVEALERAGTPDARDALEAIAKGRPGADVTEDARAAVARLGKRP